MTGNTDKTGPTPGTCGCACAPPATSRLLTVRQVGERLGVSRTQAYDLVGGGLLATVRWGGTVRVTEAALSAFIDRATVAARK